MNCFEDLEWRGLIKDITSPDLKEKLNNGHVTFYIGTDPTGDSLHIGHYSSFLISKRLAAYGHRPLLLVGGATGRIGDPRPTTEREMKPIEEIEHNIECLTKQAKEIFGFEVVNNYDWSKDINFIDFLRDYGKYFPLNYMLDKDIIKRRLETGITYTEFSYMIMQALDFLYLHDHYDCILQVAGSDQWGNITAGVDLIRKKTGKEAFAFTMPLITDEKGVKVSKSEGGKTMWLDKEKTSPYELYQYFINVDDSKVIEFLKVFTFLSREEIEALEESVKNEPEKRLAQKTLAYEVIKDLHGEEDANEARKTSEEVFSKGYSEEGMPEVNISLTDNMNIMDLLVQTNVAPSKSEARRLVQGNGISINSNKVSDPNMLITEELFEDGKLILSKGKKTHVKVNLVK